MKLAYSTVSGAIVGMVMTRNAAVASVNTFKRLLCVTIAAACALSGSAAASGSLLIVTEESVSDKAAPGLPVEIIRQVFAAMGQHASIEFVPLNRVWRMVLSGEADGMVATLRTSEREPVCYFPSEALTRLKFVLFVRSADIGKLQFSSLDDLIGHTVAVRGSLSGDSKQPAVSPELWKFMREHHIAVETDGVAESFRMLEAGRVDYALTSLVYGTYVIPRMGLSGKIEPLLSRSASEDDVYICFSKARVSPSFVQAFSRALKQFKQTEAFRAIAHRYLP